MNLRELRAAIERARSEGDLEALARLQTEFRAAPVRERAGLITIGWGDLPERSAYERESGRRILRVCPAVSRATSPTPVPASSQTLFGHFAVFNTWTEVDSIWEGNFMERVAPGAFAKTIADDRAQMRVTFNHGRDFTMGNQILGRIETLREDQVGAYYEVPLYRGIPELLTEGLRDGAYGASFRFFVMAEEWKDKPDPSQANPRGLPERTITEAKVEEFGPVSFPQYPEATAQLRAVSGPIPLRSKPTAAGSSSREITPRSREAWLASL